MYVSNLLPCEAQYSTASSGAQDKTTPPSLHFPFPTLVHNGRLFDSGLVSPGSLQGAPFDDSDLRADTTALDSHGRCGMLDRAPHGARVKRVTMITSRAAATEISATETIMAALSLLGLIAFALSM